MVVRGDIGEASGGTSPGAQGPAKLLDFTLDERRSGCRGLIKSVENVTDGCKNCARCHIENMEKPVFKDGSGKYREKMIKMTQMRAEGELDWEIGVGLVELALFFFLKKKEPTTIGEKGESRITPVLDLSKWEKRGCQKTEGAGLGLWEYGIWSDLLIFEVCASGIESRQQFVICALVAPLLVD